MARKSIERESGCWAKAAEDEPIFVLRAQDALAPAVVRAWAALAEATGACCVRKIQEALDLADAMEEWPTRKLPD
jgi:hypothetical protein